MNPRLTAWHLALLSVTSLPLIGTGVWLVRTAGGTLPQVQMVLGLVVAGVGLADGVVTSVLASRSATTLPRLIAIHAVGLASVAGVALVALPLLK